MTDNGTKEPTALEKKIIRQIEYYFGDANLKHDNFLKDQVKVNDGWVPLETMVKFNRLKILTEDFSVIATALGKSTANLMEVSEDKSKIRRLPSRPLPQETTEYRKSLRDRSVYCKGFPLDTDVGQIQEFLDKFGETEHIYMRRDGQKQFKGSVFATFKETKMANKFLEEESLKYGEIEVIKMTKENYFSKKTDERRQKRDDEKIKKQQAKEQRDREAIEAQKAEFGDYDKGCIIRFSGADDQTSREDLKEFFSEYGTVSWIDFVRGKTEGHIRFDKDTPAASVLEKANAANESKLIVRGCELETCVLEGEEEAAHWAKIHEDMSMVRLKKQQGRKGKFNKGRPAKSRGSREDSWGDSSGVKYQGTKTAFKDESDDEEEGEEVTVGEKAVKQEGTTNAPVGEKAVEQQGTTNAPVEEKAVNQEGTTKAPVGEKAVKQEAAAAPTESKGAKRPLEGEEDHAEETPAKQLKTEVETT